jgi:hypothetical protein
MLKRERSRRVLLVGAIIVTLMVSAVPARAEDGTGGVECDDKSQSCDVGAGSNPSSGPDSGSSGGNGSCHNPSGAVIPCEINGAWAGSDGCYYKPLDLSNDEIDGLGGQPAGGGGWYQRTCYNGGGGLAIVVWVPGAPPVNSPEVLARLARSRLSLPTAVVRLNPAGDQLTNLPAWLSLDRSSWAAQSATASVPGVSVTATARPMQAVWAMGDGGRVVCTGPGTPWVAGTDPGVASPDCGYVYRHSSASAVGGVFTVSVTVSWQVTWAGAGHSGTIAGLTTTGTVQVRVQESQAIITG